MTIRSRVKKLESIANAGDERRRTLVGKLTVRLTFEAIDKRAGVPQPGDLTPPLSIPRESIGRMDFEKTLSEIKRKMEGRKIKEGTNRAAQVEWAQHLPR